MLHTYIQTDIQTGIHTDLLTKWVVEELSLLKSGWIVPDFLLNQKSLIRKSAKHNKLEFRLEIHI